MKTKPFTLFLGFLFSALSLSAAQSWHSDGQRSECLLFERHTWNAQDAVDETPGYSRRCYTYTDSVFIPASLAGKCFTLSCGAANQEAWLSVNGDSVGYHAGGYTAFAFDVTPYCRVGQWNTVRIVVSNRYNENIPPLSADFTFFGGLYRDVVLTATAPAHFATTHFATRGVYIATPEVSAERATVQVSARIEGTDKAIKNVRSVQFVVRGHGFEKSVRASVRHGVAVAELTIPTPALWSPDTPHLYAVECSLYDKHGHLQDRVQERFGLRWYAFGEDGMFYLNGVRTKLIGTSRHQCYKGLGNALPDSLQRKDIELIKAMGANFLRVAHYPQGENIMRLCDSIGLLCSVEIPLVNAITESETFARRCEAMLDEMVWQNRNHASVVLWAYSNEILLRPPFKNDTARHNLYCEHAASLCRRLNARLKMLDPIRPTMIVLHDNFREYSRYGFPEAADVVGLNIYSGWYSGVFSGMDKSVERVRQALPHTPLLLTEFGADCDPRLRTAAPQRFDYSMDYALLFHRHYLSFILSSDCLAGGTVWNYNDFCSEARLGALPHYNCKGLVSADRRRKLTYFYYQSVLRHDSVEKHAADTLRQLLQLPTPTAMPLRVNMGSSCFFTDDSAHVWQPEQAYAEGSWGYVGGEAFTKKTKYGQLPAADVDIVGTDQDPLYQTARVGIQSFRADVPAGKYCVVLHFAELESADQEQMSVYNLGNEALSTHFAGRCMTIQVTPQPIADLQPIMHSSSIVPSLSLSESIGSVQKQIQSSDTINLTAQYGKYRAVQRTYTVEVANEGITISFFATLGSPILNAVEIDRL